LSFTWLSRLIAVPPKSLDILDGNEVNNGPSTQRALQEGDRMYLMCKVIGGKYAEFLTKSPFVRRCCIKRNRQLNRQSN